MRYSIVFIVFILMNGLLVSCDSSSERVDRIDSIPVATTDTVSLPSEESGHCTYKYPKQDSLLLLPAVSMNVVMLFKQADTTSEVLREIPFHSTCFVYTSDLLEMKPIIRCIHDSCLGYIQRKNLFQAFPSAFQSDVHYLVWLASHDSVKVCRINTKSRSIEDQLSLANTGMYVYASLLYSEPWTETTVALKIEMNPATCDATRFEHVIDYRNKLTSLITTSSFAEEGESWGEYIVFKKGLLLHVVKTEKSENQEDESEPVREKTEITEYQWNGDSLEFMSTNLISGN